MPRKDFIHIAVKNALIKEGWIVTDDPYRIEYEEADVYADLRADRRRLSSCAHRGGCAERGDFPMDRLNHYRTLIKQILQQHADLMNSQPVPGEEVDCVFDEQRDHYLLLKYGWPRGKHTHYTKLHVRIAENKIWIEEDMTEDGLGNELVEAGVPKEDIVLAFNPPELRNLTEYALA